MAVNLMSKLGLQAVPTPTPMQLVDGADTLVATPPIGRIGAACGQQLGTVVTVPGSD